MTIFLNFIYLLHDTKLLKHNAVHNLCIHVHVSNEHIHSIFTSYNVPQLSFEPLFRILKHVIILINCVYALNWNIYTKFELPSMFQSCDIAQQFDNLHTFLVILVRAMPSKIIFLNLD